MSKEFLNENDEMREEYDFSNAKPNPVAAYFREAGVRVLDEDVRMVFPDSEAVNTALRSLIKAARAVVPEELKKAS